LKIKRSKQEAVFSILEETELDLSSGEKEKDDLPSEEIFSKTLPQASIETLSETIPEKLPEEKPETLQEAPAETLTETIPVKLAETIPEALPEALPEPAVVRLSTALVAASCSVQLRTHGSRFSDASFVTVGPGTFIMGSPEHEPGRGRDETQHEVTLSSGFSIQETPVTQRQWKSVMGNNPSHFQQGGGDCPVEGVSWNDCQEFIKRINITGKYSYRLPTEAEWEYACRAGSSSSFFNGEITKKILSRRDPCLDAIGWYIGNSGKKTHPVAEKKPNAWGLFDMHGNVFEWCQDWYGKLGAVSRTDPRGASLGPGCVVRGGSWSSNPQDCRSARRFYRAPSLRCDIVGFRLVREP
jgi:formylglycine-generating enzyme required for sulfatase activity